jgi:hypothetical protein
VEGENSTSGPQPYQPYEGGDYHLPYFQQTYQSEHVQWVAEEYGLEQKLPQDLRRAWLSPFGLAQCSTSERRIIYYIWSTGGGSGVDFTNLFLILHFLEIRH